jgi:hypothetical protein
MPDNPASFFLASTCFNAFYGLMHGSILLIACYLFNDFAISGFKYREILDDIFITDRTQLDTQLKSTFEKTQGETVYHAKSVADFKALLQKDASDLVIGMMQKFQEGDDFEFPVLNASDKIVSPVILVLLSLPSYNICTVAPSATACSIV